MIAPLRRLPAACLLLVAASGCTTVRLREADAVQERLELADVPFFAQTEHQCGPASLAMTLGASGLDVAPEVLSHEVYTPGLKGSLQAELQAAARRHGRLPYTLAPTLPALVRELEAGRPVLVLQNFGLSRAPLWHYAVVIGYQRASDRFVLRTGTTRRELLAAARFDGTWRRGGSWAMVVLRPGEVPVTATAADYVVAAQALAASTGPSVAGPAFDAAVARWPDESLVWLALGNLRLMRKEDRAAEDAFAEAVRRRPGDAAARNNRALLLARRGCVAAARAEIELALKNATGTSLEASVADSAKEIRQSAAGATDTGCPAP